VCTIPCEVPQDCPDGFACQDIAIADFPFARACVD
jgi:hypothetical protein